MRIALPLVLSCLAACGSDQPTADAGWQVPDDVEALFVAGGPADADAVVIFVQGGPFPELRSQLAESLPDMDGRRWVAVHQPWTLEPGLLSAPEEVTQTEAARLNLAALEMVDRVVRHFRAQGVDVSVVGHSYGALLTQLWVGTKPTPVPTRILAGRLALPEIVVTGFRNGSLYWFPDGASPEPLSGETPTERIVAMRLQSDVGGRPFLDLLADADLSRLTFVYGERDRLVGSLTEAEVAFLTARGAKVVKLAGGDHRAMWEPEHRAAMEAAFRREPR